MMETPIDHLAIVLDIRRDMNDPPIPQTAQNAIRDW
jgi:hypothetical protein